MQENNIRLTFKKQKQNAVCLSTTYVSYRTRDYERLGIADYQLHDQCEVNYLNLRKLYVQLLLTKILYDRQLCYSTMVAATIQLLSFKFYLSQISPIAIITDNTVLIAVTILC